MFLPLKWPLVATFPVVNGYNRLWKLVDGGQSYCSNEPRKHWESPDLRRAAILNYDESHISCQNYFCRIAKFAFLY